MAMGSLTKTEVMSCNAAISLDFHGGLGEMDFLEKYLSLIFYFMSPCRSVGVCMCTTHMEVCRKSLESLKLKLEIVMRHSMWVLRTKYRSPTRGVCNLDS